MTEVSFADRDGAMVDMEALVPVGPLGEWLRAQGIADGGGSPVVTKIGEGRSNLTFRVTWGRTSVVLRRPPMGDLPETAHDMMREHHVLSALSATPVRAPRPVVACADEAVIGVPFYLMEEVEGIVIRETLPEQFVEGTRRHLGFEMIDALVELHTVDPSAVGLGDLGRPHGYTARQVARWSRQWEFMKTRELDDVEAVRGWLEGHVPEQSAAAIVHGDYKFDNVVFARTLPPRLEAILDWEMATLGDPLADLGYLMLLWPEPGEPNIAGLAQPTQEPGFPRRVELIARYEEATGFALTDIGFYRTLALWKLAVLCEGLFKRYLAGKADSDWFAVLEDAVPAMARQAREWTGA